MYTRTLSCSETMDDCFWRHSCVSDMMCSVALVCCLWRALISSDCEQIVALLVERSFWRVELWHLDECSCFSVSSSYIGLYTYVKVIISERPSYATGNRLTCHATSTNTTLFATINLWVKTEYILNATFYDSVNFNYTSIYITSICTLESCIQDMLNSTYDANKPVMAGFLFFLFHHQTYTCKTF